MNFRSLSRSFTQSPLFALIVFALVAAVVAVNATTFGGINTLRWKVLPYAADDSLVWLQLKLTKIDNESSLSEKWRAELAHDKATFHGVAGFVDSGRTRSDSSGQPWRIAEVTPQLDAVLGVSPALGRGIADDDVHTGADRVLVISDALWRSRFGADPGILGRTVHFGERSDTIIGVMPRGFAFPDTQTDAWRPFVPPMPVPEVDGIGEMEVVARLGDDATLERARISLDRVFDGGKSLGPFGAMFSSLGPQAHAEPWRAHFVARHGQALSMLQVAALILLLAVAANLVNLQLDRLLGRSREFDIRRALGAGERAIGAQALQDVLLPTLAGAVVGLALAVPGMRILAMRRLLPEGMPIEPGFDVVMLGSAVFVVTVVFVTALVAARAMRGQAALSARVGTAGVGKFRLALLVGQIMLTTALLGSASLLLRSAINVLDVNRGFDATGVLMTGIDLSALVSRRPDYDPRNDGALKSAIADVLARAAALPGVRHVATADVPPFSGGDSFMEARIPGQSEPQQIRQRTVSSDFFATLAIPLVGGRTFSEADLGNVHGSPVIVDQLYVQRYLSDHDPLTASIGLDANMPEGEPDRMVPIIGIVHTVKNNSLEEKADMPTIYRVQDFPNPMFILLVRSDHDVSMLVEPMRRLVQQRMPDALIAFNQPLAQRVATSFSARRGLLETIGGFAALTLALAALGLAAVLGFAIRRRSSELGVRMALGATPTRIRRLVLRQGSVLIAVGLALGLVAGLALARLLSDTLFGVSFIDPLTWTTTLLLVAAIALFACWIPARRAARTDPMVALRNE